MIEISIDKRSEQKTNKVLRLCIVLWRYIYVLKLGEIPKNGIVAFRKKLHCFAVRKVWSCQASKLWWKACFECAPGWEYLSGVHQRVHSWVTQEGRFKDGAVLSDTRFSSVPFFHLWFFISHTQHWFISIWMKWCWICWEEKKWIKQANFRDF